MMKKLALLVIIALLASCSKDMMEVADSLGENGGIIGTWVENRYEDDVTFLSRADSLDVSLYGFTINDNGTFIERKNAGWCGTPPITYANYEGEWEALSDSLLEITVGYWGGTMTYQIRIVSLDQQNLGIRYLYAEDRADSR